MPESTSFVFMPKVIAGALSGAGNLQTIIPVNGRKYISFQEYWDGTLAGTPQLWTSNDYRDPGNGDPVGIAAAEARAHWTLVTDPAITTWLTTDPSASPPGGMPNGAPGDGVLSIPVVFAAIRWRLTWVSGSGNYTLDANARD
jgi:hypothetical protein